VERERLVWGNCAALWGRLFVLSGSIWKRLPASCANAEAAFVAAIKRGAYGEGAAVDDLRSGLLEFGLNEDDGTPEFQYAIDLMDSLYHALSGWDAARTLTAGSASYLDSVYSEVAKRLADSKGRVVSVAEMDLALGDDETSLEANAFVTALKGSASGQM
jgi:hypothetical protein